MKQNPKIAVIGAGISGMSASWLSQNRAQVTLFEKENRLGGHVNTIVISDGPDQGIGVDTGFIVCNDRNYPNLHRFFGELNVQVRNSDMSFGYLDQKSGMAYSGRGWQGLLANKANLFKFDFYAMMSDFLRFNKLCLGILASGTEFPEERLGDFLKRHRFSPAFIRHYLVPMGAAIWSTSNEEMLDFPTSVFLYFFKNHGLLSLDDRPQWQTVKGGSHSYVHEFQKKFKGEIRLGANIQRVVRQTDGVQIHHADGSVDFFDHVIFALHADQVLPLLADPSTEEQAMFGVWQFQQNKAILHTDTRVLPKQEMARASWNFVQENLPKSRHPVAVTYDMNRLQGLNTHRHYLVSLNLSGEIASDKIIREIDYEHPSFNPATIASRQKIRALSGSNHTSFAGAWFHNGFHEDGIRSSVEMLAQDFGWEW